MVVGGRPNVNQSDLIDISGENQNCPLIQNFPAAYDSFGTFINNKSLVCGGRTSYTFYSECYSYDFEVNSFNMSGTL